MREKGSMEDKKEFLLPNYSKFKEDTENLEQHFGALAKRYICIPYPIVRQQVKQLEDIYTRQKKSKPPKHRLEEISCITQLLNFLPESGDDKILTQARSVLLGANFFRLYRLNHSYDSTWMGFFGTAEDNSILDKTIKEVTGIVSSGDKKNELDDLTLYTTCLAYRDYLMQKGKDNKYVWEHFSHIKKDHDAFFKKLNKIISKAQNSGKPLQDQINYIDFIVSIETLLKTNDSHLDTLLVELEKRMNRHLQEKETLDAEAVLACFLSLNPTLTLQQVIKDQVPSDYEIKRDTTEKEVDHDDPKPTVKGFIEFIKKINDYINTNILLGAYVLCLTKCNSERQHLADAYYNAIGVDWSNKLDNKARDNALIALENFLKPPQNREFISEQTQKAWGSQGHLAAHLADVRREVSKILVEEEECKMENEITFSM